MLWPSQPETIEIGKRWLVQLIPGENYLDRPVLSKNRHKTREKLLGPHNFDKKIGIKPDFRAATGDRLHVRRVGEKVGGARELETYCAKKAEPCLMGL
jgi:hypothetical protein